jgi:hypothetical protein
MVGGVMGLKGGALVGFFVGMTVGACGAGRCWCCVCACCICC